MNPIPPTSDALIGALDAASANDVTRNGGFVPPGFASERSVVSVRHQPVRQEQMLAGQKTVVAHAFDENSPSGAYSKALDALEAIHSQWKHLNDLTEDCQHRAVKAEYIRLVDLASERLIAGDTSAQDVLESERDIETRFQAERDALDEGIRKLGIASIAPAVIVAKEIDNALAALARRLEARDADDCRTFGIELEYGITTRLVQSIRLQFEKRTFDLKRFSTMHPGSACTVFAKGMFGDFIDLSSWR